MATRLPEPPVFEPGGSGPVVVRERVTEAMSWWCLHITERATVRDVHRALQALPCDAMVWGSQCDCMDDSTTIMFYQIGVIPPE
jgi:hypothetical protein